MRAEELPLMRSAIRRPRGGAAPPTAGELTPTTARRLAAGNLLALIAPGPIPLASFASVMGVTGLGLAWRVAAISGRAPAVIGDSLLVAGAALFIALTVVWLARIATRPDEIRTELAVAITASYLGTIVISLSLLAAAAVPFSHPIAFALWLCAAVGGAGLLIYLIGRWIERGLDVIELTPAIFIPVVGNATSVYAAVPLGMVDFGWASFSIGTLCWLAFAPIVLYRLIAVAPRLPRKMAPQLAVLVSSPAVLASSWFSLGGAADAVFKVLLFKSVFFAFLTLRLWRMAWGEKYNVGMWGWTFPAAALAGALERGASSLRSPLYDALAWVAIALASFAVLACAIATIAGWLRVSSGLRAALRSE